MSEFLAGAGDYLHRPTGENPEYIYIYIYIYFKYVYIYMFIYIYIYIYILNLYYSQAYIKGLCQQIFIHNEEALGT